MNKSRILNRFIYLLHQSKQKELLLLCADENGNVLPRMNTGKKCIIGGSSLEGRGNASKFCYGHAEMYKQFRQWIRNHYGHDRTDVYLRYGTGEYKPSDDKDKWFEEIKTPTVYENIDKRHDDSDNRKAPSPFKYLNRNKKIISEFIIPKKDYRTILEKYYEKSDVIQQCRQCGEVKAIQSFDIDNQNPNGHVFICKQCRKLNYEKNKSYRKQRKFYYFKIGNRRTPTKLFSKKICQKMRFFFYRILYNIRR